MVAAISFFALTFAAAGFGSRFRPGPWYATLAKPKWTPPNWLFAPVWTLLYVMMTVAAWLIHRDTQVIGWPLILWFVQLLLNALWPWCFFGLKRPDIAFAEIAILLLMIAATVVAFMSFDRVAGVLLLPYLMWVSFATALNFARRFSHEYLTGLDADQPCIRPDDGRSRIVPDGFLAILWRFSERRPRLAEVLPHSVSTHGVPFDGKGSADSFVRCWIVLGCPHALYFRQGIAMRQLKKIGIALGICAAAAWMTAAAVEQGEAAPHWRAADFDGGTVDFPAVADGKPTVMVFWATWCPYCRAFMPYLKQIQTDYAADGVRIVAINAKEDGRGDPRTYIEGLGFTPIAVADGDAIAAAYDVEYIPGLLIVDGAGTVAYRRPWTDLPAGRTVAELWDDQVRTALDGLLQR